jgi:hypothetical protein
MAQAQAMMRGMSPEQLRSQMDQVCSQICCAKRSRTKKSFCGVVLVGPYICSEKLTFHLNVVMQAQAQMNSMSPDEIAAQARQGREHLQAQAQYQLSGAMVR